MAPEKENRHVAAFHLLLKPLQPTRILVLVAWEMQEGSGLNIQQALLLYLIEDFL
jgi:hypothetical protein